MTGLLPFVIIGPDADSVSVVCNRRSHMDMALIIARHMRRLPVKGWLLVEGAGVARDDNVTFFKGLENK